MPPAPPALMVPPFRLTSFKALNSTKPPSASSSWASAVIFAPCSRLARLSAKTITLPPALFSAEPEELMREPCCRFISPLALTTISPAAAAALASARIVPELVTSFSAKILILPSLNTNGESTSMPPVLTISDATVGLRLARISPVLVTLPALTATASSAFILPLTEMTPAGLIGRSPASTDLVASSEMLPSSAITCSINSQFGVESISEPTLTTPLLPMATPCGFKIKTLPPILPFLIEFRIPSILVFLSRTRLIRLSVAVGRCKLTVVPL